MKFVLPLPLFEPSVYTAHNELCRGQMVLALYPDTTCFYKALVHTPPSLRRQRDYLVEFEDESEPSGRSEAQNVPQKYVLRIPDYAR
jgi:SAGA-associated factor 29